MNAMIETVRHSSLVVEIDGPVATITLDRPERRNAMNTEMVHEMLAVLEGIAFRREIRIVVLTGSGDRFFCPGADLAPDPDRDGRPPPPLPAAWELRAPVLLHEMPQLTIAAINGACAGAGLGYAAACDIRVASESARFATAFLDVGVAGDMGLPWTLTAAVGGARARELFFLRGKFDAAEALRISLVSAVYPVESFRTEVAAIVERLSHAAPQALVTMKANFLAAERLGFSDYVDLETERHLQLVVGPEFRAGTEAFVARRAQTTG